MKLLLRITKYLFLLIITVFIIIVFIFIYYSKKLNFDIPEMVDITVYDKDNNLFLTLNNENKQSYVKLENISPYVIDAIISIEDKKFYEHKGIDIMRIGGALFKNIESNEIREGASTITQQYARLLYLSPEKKVKRKVEEAMIAMNLETKYSKNQILEGYLNTIYFDHGIYGIGDASRFYFNKDAIELTIAEAATLCAIPKGPIHYSPIRNIKNNTDRKILIINELYNDGKITFDEAVAAKNEELKFHANIQTTNELFAPYYQDLIVRELKSLHILENYKATELKIHTTLDLDMNTFLLDSISKYYPKDKELQIAAYAMDPKTGHVLSVIGGVDYQESTFNRATDALRQPGSTIKPFLYYAALNNGFTPITTFNSAPTDFYVNGKVYSPSNYGKIYPNQDVTMAYAIATSDNIYAVKTHLFLGTSTLYNTLKDFGFSTPILETPSLALGTSEVKLSELTTGYARLANLGKEVSPVYITKILDENDKVIYTNTNENEQIYNKTNAYILTQTMTNTFDNRLRINISATGAPISNMLTHKYAAKTGTTDTDSWIVGYNSDIVIGIWTGYDDNRYLENADAKYIKYVWADAIEKYMKGKGDGWYSWIDDTITIKLNPVTGKLAAKDEYSKELYFDAENIPWYLFDDLDY